MRRGSHLVQGCPASSTKKTDKQTGAGWQFLCFVCFQFVSGTVGLWPLAEGILGHNHKKILLTTSSIHRKIGDKTYKCIQGFQQQKQTNKKSKTMFIQSDADNFVVNNFSLPQMAPFGKGKTAFLCSSLLEGLLDAFANSIVCPKAAMV